ncbi:OTU domain-containing protein 5-like isoform X2 [Tubulanus polymorphus]|uniref:OTU domain-containing protein 5-like isoform X2 n=1 Tax=Tubulanus polymorphus TaxID=672921 RepID=UPI003DA5A768
MTILPKKKVSKEKSEKEPSHSGEHHLNSIPSDTRVSHSLSHVSRARNSPPRWPTGQLDETFAGHDPGGVGSPETSAGNKRRHRTSPHRNTRKHRNHGSSRADRVQQTSTAGPNSSPVVLDSVNSEDEYETEKPLPVVVPAEPQEYDAELEQWFTRVLKEKRGFIIKEMGTDGACLFRSVADQVYGDQEMHGIVRKHTLDYIAKNRDHFSQYITEDFNTYLNRKRMDNCHGNHIEMQAISELFNRPVEVYQYGSEAINTFHGSYKTEDVPIRISYHRNTHYNSVVDPYQPSVGVGLGLPGFQPGLADRNLMRDAVRQSEELQIEQTMLADKLKETDWEVTQETIEEQVARESYLQWLKDNEKRAKHHSSPRTASMTIRSPRSRNSQQNSPNQLQTSTDDFTLPVPNPAELLTSTPGSAMHSTSAVGLSNHDIGACCSSDGAIGGSGFGETTSLMNQLPPTMFGLAEWDDDDIIAQVIAQSQQEYLDTLKKNVSNSGGTNNKDNETKSLS